MNYNISQTNFPSHDVDPRKKKEAPWCLQAAKAILSNWSNGMPVDSIFFAKQAKYSIIADYAMNKQSIADYIKRQTHEDNADSAYINIDQSTEAIVKTHRQKILGRLKKIDYNIVATPIDALSKSKLDEYYTKQKVKLTMRQEAEKLNQDVANSEPLAINEGEPSDMEDLEMEMLFPAKFIRANNTEKAIDMIFNENNMPDTIDLVDENLVDYGVAILREEIDANNKVVIKRIDPARFICSKVEDGNFNEDEMSYAGDIRTVKISTLARHFNDEEIEKISDACKGKFGNPSSITNDSQFSKGIDDFKADVFCFQIRSYDTKVIEERKDKRGNLKSNYADIKKADKSTDKAKYLKEECEVVYRGKWVIGTDFIYDYGLENGSKRSMNTKFIRRTSLGYHVIASSFHNMCAKGVIEDLIPIADEIHATILKLRNLNNRMIINGLSIDFTALENVALGGSGEKALTPQENLNMLFQIGIIGYRSEQINGDGKAQRKPVEALTIDYANQFTALWDNYTRNVNKLYEISGLNQATDAATVNPKMLVGVANAQNAATNNALYFLENARRKLLQRVARHSFRRMQSALVSGTYEGYVQSLGKNTMDYFKFEAKDFPYDYDIIFEDKPTEEQKQIFYQALQKEIASGFLTTADVFTITNNNSLRDCEIILSYKAKKAQERMQQEARAREEANGQMQQQSAIVAEQAKQETLRVEYKLKTDLKNVEKEWDYKIRAMELGSAENIAQDNVHGKLADTVLKNQEGVPPSTEEATEVPQTQQPMQEEMPQNEENPELI